MDSVFLIDLETDGLTLGQVVDTGLGLKYPPNILASILAHSPGGWDEYHGDLDPLEVLSKATLSR